MLDLITKSKIRQKIVLLFVYNPEKAHYINEIARMVKISAGTAQRGLERLLKSGLLSKEKKPISYILDLIQKILFWGT